MSYLSLQYAFFSAALLIVYYLFSGIGGGRFQWIVLLLGSLFFYYTWTKTLSALCLFLIPVIAGYAGGLLLEKNRGCAGKRKAVLLVSILSVALPLAFFRFKWVFPLFTPFSFRSVVVPIGLSFYTLQLIAYLVDCWRENTSAQRDPFKFLLFATFFPQIIQGPIPRYSQLSSQLFERHPFEYKNLVKGTGRIVWGVYLKLMIADKAAVVVNRVFDGGGSYVGGCIIVAAVLYSIQLYTDFYSCTSISLGVARLFGIELPENFARPYFAVSIKDFWRRWHITLSSWLRDYIYIPLGGSQKGTLRKYVNILLVFLISGFWHGNQLQFIIWGLLHALYQIVGDASSSARDRVYDRLKIRRDSLAYRSIKRAGVFFLTTFGWVFFRSESAAQGFRMIKDAFVYRNPWTIWGAGLFSLGLDYYDIWLLAVSIAILVIIGSRQEHGVDMEDWFVRQHIFVRWALLYVMIIVIWVFGTYGYGFNAQDFIYGGF